MAKPHILIAVTGSIAAYKACDLVSALVKKEFDVKVILSESAARFVAPITFETLSHHKTETQLFDPASPDPIAHISLAKWADILAVVPATANIMAKMAWGLADDIVSTTALACTCPILVFPAMNVHMYENEATQHNIRILESRNIQVIEPAEGHLACDDTGKGKLPDVPFIAQTIADSLCPKPLAGKTVLVSAGPTQEALDPVRFISNHSSGKQGYAVAEAARKMGARVILVSGPTALPAPYGIQRTDVVSAEEMFSAMKKFQPQADYIVMAAAVGDYRPRIQAAHKIKKKADELSMEFVKNPDILAWLGAHKKPGQVLCGFAMETQDLLKNAREKLESKNCDLLVANNLFVEGAGFQNDTNVVSLLLKDQNLNLEKCSKARLGEIILQTMQKLEETEHVNGH